MLALLLLVCACSAETGTQNNADDKAQAAECTLLIECSSVFEHWDELPAEKQELIPEDGVLLSASIKLEEGDTVCDVFTRVVQSSRLHADTVVSSGSAYVRGIGNLYEGDCGGYSGWMVYVNGELLMTGISNQPVSEGDEIAFRYVCEMPEELG